MDICDNVKMWAKLFCESINFNSEKIPPEMEKELINLEYVGGVDYDERNGSYYISMDIEAAGGHWREDEDTALGGVDSVLEKYNWDRDGLNSDGSVTIFPK